MAPWLSWLERRANNAKVMGSIPLGANFFFLLLPVDNDSNCHHVFALRVEVIYENITSEVSNQVKVVCT